MARLNRACGCVEFMGDRMDTSDLYQTDVSRAMNSDLFKPSKTIDYVHPYELLIQDFQTMIKIIPHASWQRETGPLRMREGYRDMKTIWKS